MWLRAPSATDEDRSVGAATGNLLSRRNRDARVARLVGAVPHSHVSNTENQSNVGPIGRI